MSFDPLNPRLGLRLALLLAALIHWLPLPGLPGAGTLESLYGLPELDPSTALLLQHRALMFSLFGAALLVAMVKPDCRNPAIALVLVSDIGFCALALAQWPLPAPMQRVLWFDLVSIGLLVLSWILSRRPPGDVS